MQQQPLTDTERSLLVEYRLQRAKEALAEADSLIESKIENITHYSMVVYLTAA